VALEPTVRATTGRALLRDGAADLAVLNRVGRGRTVFLNALLDRKDASREAWREVVRAVLADASVRPAVEIADPAGRPVTQVRVARYRFASHELVALLDGRLDAGTRYGRDGVAVYESEAEGRVVRREVDVALPHAARITNARTGEELGTTRRLRTTLTAGDALVLSLGGERTAIRLEAPVQARRGEPVVFTVRYSDLQATVSAAGSEPAPTFSARRLLRFHVTGPDGSFLPEYAQVTAADDAAPTFTFPSALNDPPGDYRVRVADVLTGASAEATLRLE
jgi:hypothetical protein